MSVARPVSIALIDDFAPIRKMIGHYLTGNGFSVACEANNGQELMTYLEQTRTLPEICLMDLNMPVMDGFEATTLVKLRFPAIRVLAYSTNNHPKRLSRILACGADGFIDKISAPAEIKNALRVLLKNPRRSA